MYDLEFMWGRSRRKIRDFLVDRQRMLDQEANHPPVEFVGMLLCQKACVLEYDEALNLNQRQSS